MNENEEKKLVITYIKQGNKCKIEIHGQHGVDWPHIVEEANESVMSSLKDQYKNDTEEYIDNLLENLSKLRNIPVKDLKKELESMKGSIIENIIQMSLKHMQKELEEITTKRKKK